MNKNKKYNKIFKLLTLGIFLISSISIFAQTPITRGILKTDLNGNNKSITDVNNLSATSVNANALIALSINAGITNNRMLYVDWQNGNDTNAVPGRVDKPYKFVYDIYERTNVALANFAGAYFSAQPGDTIVIVPGVHYLPLIPLPDSVNLWIQPGATVIHCNFSNALLGNVSTPLSAASPPWGPFIQPGNNSIVTSVGSYVVATNNTESANSMFGWLEIVTATNLVICTTEGFNIYYIWNRLDFSGKTNVSYYPGVAHGAFDNMIFFHTNTTPASVKIFGGEITSGYDSILAAATRGTLDLKTYGMFIDSTNTFSVPSLVRGAYILQGTTWKDYNSIIYARGGTNQTSGVFATSDINYNTNGYATVELNNTSIYVSSPGEGVTNNNGATITFGGLSTADIKMYTNYIAANFVPIEGQIRLVTSNNVLWAISTMKTNVVVNLE